MSRLPVRNDPMSIWVLPPGHTMQKLVGKERVFETISPLDLSLLVEKPEKGMPFIGWLIGGEGSHRFVYMADKTILAALQIVEMDPGKSVVGNVYTRPEYRGMGIAGLLLKLARMRLGDVKHSTHLSPSGAGFARKYP